MATGPLGLSSVGQKVDTCVDQSVLYLPVVDIYRLTENASAFMLQYLEGN